MNEPKVPENRAYVVTLILLVGLAAFSTAMKDVNRLQEMVSSVQQLSSLWPGTDLTMLNVESISTDESCQNSSPQLMSSPVESGYTEMVGPAHGEIDRIEFESVTQPEIGGSVELVITKKPHRSPPHLARAKYAARNLKEELSAKRRDSHWPARIEYRTSDRVVTLDFPMTVITEIKADALDNEGLPDFPRGLLGRIGRKHPGGKTDNVRREFILRKFEREL